MKKLTLLLALLFSIHSFATVHTVSNSPATLAQFNTIQAAIDASTAGDTIYVHGSPNPYAGFTISNIQLVVIGPGWAPSKNLPLLARINTVTTITGSLSSGTEIQGLCFETSFNITTNNPNNIRFIRNRFSSSATVNINQNNTTYVGYLFEGNSFVTNIVVASTNSTYQNFLFQNNYFYYNSVFANIQGLTNSVNVLFNHNIWFGPPSGSRFCFGNNCRFLTLTNNIFVRRDAGTENSQSTFNNNITFNAGNNTPWLSNGNLNSGGNIENQDPKLNDSLAINAGTENPLLDFTILNGPANNAGSDGKDMGLLFDANGSLNWTTSRTSRLPFIFSMNIVNPTIAPGGSLSVEVEGRRNN